jgi:hypothetical protein
MAARENKILPMKTYDCDVMSTTMLAVGITNILLKNVNFNHEPLLLL